MRIALLFIIGILFSSLLHSQEPKVLIEISSEEINLEQLIIQAENKDSYQFYFDPSWAREITIKSKLGSNVDFFELLAVNQISYYIENNVVIIYKGKPIISELPASNGSKDIEDKVGVVYAEQTQAEKKYLEGRKVEGVELIEVGNKSRVKPGENVIIQGKISDNASGEPLIGATVFIQELGQGAATDLDGRFQLVVKPGKYFVSATSLSMQEKKFYLQVHSGGNIDIPLNKELVSVNEVVVYADKVDNVGGMQMGFERISSKTMKEIPVVMGERDLLKVAQMLPGVQSAGEGASGINVRGGTADQNLFYINKLPVYNTSHLFGFFTAFNSDVVNNFSLYKSNIPASFGGRLSSIFDISTRQGNKKEFFAQGGISPVTARISVEGPIIKEKTSFVLSYRTTYSDWLLTQMDDVNLQNSEASFYDLSAGVNGEINDKNLMKVFFYGSHDKFSLSTSDDYEYSNTGGSVIWKHFFSSSMNVDVSAVLSNYGFLHDNKANPTDAYSHEYELNHNELKADFVYLTPGNHKITFGASGILYQLNRGNINPYGDESNRVPILLGEEKGIESAVYISDEFSVLPNLTLLAGIRYSFYAMLGPEEVNEYFPNSPIDENNISETKSFSSGEVVKSYNGPEPRIALNYRLGNNHSLKGSYNRTRQYIFMLSNTIAISPTDQWKLADYHLKPPTSDQVSLGYYFDFPNKGIVTSIEGYRKWTNNVVEYKDGIDFLSPDPTEMLLLQGEQDSYGAEFMFKKNAGKLTGWLSYTYSRASVIVENDLPTEQINYGKRYPSNFDRPHSLNFVSTLKVNRRLSLSSNIVYATGRPVTYPIASYYSDGQEVLHYSERNKYRIPDYFRIDLSINLEGNLDSKKWIHSYWMLNIYNVTGRANAYSVYFEAKDGQMQGYKLSVFGQPIVTLSWNFKFGNYLSN